GADAGRAREPDEGLPQARRSTDRGIPRAVMTTTIGNAVDWWAEDAPGRLAIAYPDDRVTYGALKPWTDRVAAFLAEHGIEPGERVAILDANSLAWCAAALGTIKSGAILVTF